MSLEDDVDVPTAADLAFWANTTTDEPTINTTGNWTRLDLTDPAYRIPPDPPAIAGLLYAAKRHVLSGPQESAKTLIAYHLLLQAHRDGHPVAIIDFEMGPTACTQMLLDLGATIQELAAIYYTEPDGPPTKNDINAIVTHQTRWALLDAAAGAYDTSDLDDNSRKDAERFARLWILPLRRHGIATLVLDHVTKDTKGRGKYAIGSERKTGQAEVHLGFEALKTLSRGGTGLVKITSHKDRPGFLSRPTVAMVDLHSDPDTHAITTHIREPATVDEETGEFRPTVLMHRISQQLQKHTEPMSLNQIETTVTGKAEYVRLALEILVHEDYVVETAGARGARLFTHLEPFPDPQNDLVPTSSPPRPDEVPVTSSDLVPPRPPLQGDGTGSAGTGKPKTNTTSSRDGDEVKPDELDVYDPAVQALLDDDGIPF